MKVFDSVCTDFVRRVSVTGWHLNPTNKFLTRGMILSCVLHSHFSLRLDASWNIIEPFNQYLLKYYFLCILSILNVKDMLILWVLKCLDFFLKSLRLETFDIYIYNSLCLKIVYCSSRYVVKCFLFFTSCTFLFYNSLRLWVLFFTSRNVKIFVLYVLKVMNSFSLGKIRGWLLKFCVMQLPKSLNSMTHAHLVIWRTTAESGFTPVYKVRDLLMYARNYCRLFLLLDFLKYDTKWRNVWGREFLQ